MICIDSGLSAPKADRLSDTCDESLLLEYVATRDSRVFGELVKRYEGELYEHLRRYVGDAETARDALQNTWLQLHLKCDMYEPGRKLRPWLYTVAVHQAIDVARAQRRHRMLSLDQPPVDMPARGVRLGDCLTSPTGTSAEAATRRETRADVRRAVSRLPAHLRTLVTLVFFDGLKYREAARELAVPEGTAKSRMHAAFGRLQAGLGQLAT